MFHPFRWGGNMRRLQGAGCALFRGLGLMRGWVAAVLVSFALIGAAQADCVGQNLMAAMPPAEAEALRDVTSRVPFATGNRWRAVKGKAEVDIIGTYHMEDTRHDATLTALGPVLDRAAVVLVEAGQKEMAALKARMAKDPGLMVNTTGPTLPEVLSEADWQKLTKAMQARGVPAFMAAKLQPWYLSMLLSIPPCAMAGMGGDKGLDARLIEVATARDLPVQALEPYDTVFGIFGQMTQEEQLSMVTAALALDDQAEDMSVTMADAYFAEEGRLIWEFMRAEALKVPGADPAAVEAEFATMEEAMMIKRNQSWIPVIEAAVEKGPVLAAFGALHLSGENGVLALLEKAGFTVERLAFQ